jgi:protein SYS1
MGTLWGINHIVFDTPVSLDHFFTSKYIDFVTIAGWIETLSSLICSIGGAYLLSFIVERSKKCVDFTFTLYFLHITLTMMYQQSFPLEWEWWLTNVVASVAMATFGELLCARNELQDIPLYSPP